MYHIFKDINFSSLGLTASSKPKRYYSLKEIIEDYLGLLEDFDKQGIYFCKFEDQFLTIEYKNQTYFAFGVSNYGIFLLDSKGKIQLFLYELDIYDQRLMPVNHSMGDFIDIYLEFMICMFKLKRLRNYSQEAYNLISIDFSRFLEVQYPHTLEKDSYWSQIKYEIDDAMISFKNTLTTYALHQRYEL